jgi:hypothetical protein
MSSVNGESLPAELDILQTRAFELLLPTVRFYCKANTYDNRNGESFPVHCKIRSGQYPPIQIDHDQYLRSLDTLIRQNASSDDESSTNTHSLYGLNAEFLNPAPKIPGLAKSRAGQGLFQNLSTVKLHIRHRAELVSAEDPNIPSSPTNTNTSTPPLAIFKMDFDLVPVVMRSTFSDVLFEIFGHAFLGSGVAK